MKIFLLDSNSILCRYFFARPEQFTEDGINVNGLYGYCKLIKDIISQNFHRDFLIIPVFDRCSLNFRKDIFPEYKSNRKRSDSSLVVQLNFAEDVCRKIGLQTQYHLKYEADDIIASFCDRYEDFDITVLTSDKDLLQLVHKDIKVFNPFTKEVFTREAVYKKMKVYPEHIPLFLALCGDSSDNIPGIPKIGPKSAVKIIETGLPLKEIPIHFPLFNFKTLDLMIELTTLNRNYETKNISNFIPDIPTINSIFSSLNFKNLLFTN